MKKNALFPSGCTLIIGASGGIGSGVAEVLAQDGAELALAYHSNRERAEAMAVSIGATTSTHQLDVTSVNSVTGLVSDVVAHHGRINGMVWAAGPLVEQHSIGETPLEAWHRAFAVETHGFLNMVTALLPSMRKNGGGSIVHLGSAGHLRWPDRDGLSVVPKAANESLIKGIAREEGRHGIRANSVLVGVIDAGMFQELMEKGAFPPGWEDETKKALAIKRWGRPEEIGYAASWLVSVKSGYVTGQQINVSGGYGI